MEKQVAVGAGGSLERVRPRRGSEGQCVWGSWEISKRKYQSPETVRRKKIIGFQNILYRSSARKRVKCHPHIRTSAVIFAHLYTQLRRNRGTKN